MAQAPEISQVVNAEIGRLAKCFTKIDLGLQVTTADTAGINADGRKAIMARFASPQPIDAEIAVSLRGRIG